MVKVCKHCGAEVTRTTGGQWVKLGDTLFPQYCWVDPAGGSRLHEVEAENPPPK